MKKTARPEEQSSQSHGNSNTALPTKSAHILGRKTLNRFVAFAGASTRSSPNGHIRSPNRGARLTVSASMSCCKKRLNDDPQAGFAPLIVVCGTT